MEVQNGKFGDKLRMLVFYRTGLYERYKYCHRNSKGLQLLLITIVAVHFLCAIIFSSVCIAASSSSKMKEYVELYLAIAFSSGTKSELRKIEVEGAIPLEVNCSIIEKATCESMKDILKHAVETSGNVRFRFDVDPVVRIEFFDHVNQAAVLRSAVDQFVNGEQETSDSKCSVFISTNGAKISNAKLIVSSEQSILKIKACLIVQIGRALGLGTIGAESFEKMWNNKPVGLSSFSEPQLHKLKTSYSFYEYTQMCPDLRAGMSSELVRMKLLEPDGCLSKLGGSK